jgi:hypothetical protein
VAEAQPTPDVRKTFRIGRAGQTGQEDLKVFMSFQRLNSLLRILEIPERLSLITVDPDLTEPCLRALISPTAAGQYDINLDDYEIEVEVTDEMIIWCRDHLAHFFMKRLREAVASNTDLGPLVKDLQLSLAGSEPSTSEPAAAGPSE